MQVLRLLIADKKSDTIELEGIQNLLSDLKLAPDDILLGYLYYLMNAKNSCEFSKAEFSRLAARTASSSLAELQKHLPNLRK
jgi:hypothetical protein